MRRVTFGIAVAESLILTSYAISIIIAAIQVNSKVGSPISETIIYLIFALAIYWVGRGMDKSQSWARTPFFVIQAFVGITAYTLFVGTDISYKISGILLAIIALVGVIALLKTPISD
jgi:hypothetical protein